MKKAAMYLAPLAMLALGACATPFNADVSRFQELPAPQGQTFVIRAADPANAGGIEFGQYAALVGGESRDAFAFQVNKSVKTRDQVRAELAAARASGLIDVLDSDSHTVFFAPAGKSAVTRAQVQADLANARAHGDTASLENNS